MSDIKRQLQKNNEELAEMIESVNDMTLHLQNLKVTENGTYTAGAGYDAIGQVTVNVTGGPAIETCTVVLQSGYGNIYSAAAHCYENGELINFYYDQTGIDYTKNLTVNNVICGSAIMLQHASSIVPAHSVDNSEVILLLQNAGTWVFSAPVTPGGTATITVWDDD